MNWGQKVVDFRELGGPGVLPLPAEVHHVVGGAAATFEVAKPEGAQYVVVRAESGNFRVRGGLQAARSWTHAEVDPDEDAINIASHGYRTGDGPLRVSADDTSPASALSDELSAGTDYWVFVVDDDNVKLCLNRGHAMRVTADGTPDPVVVDLVDVGVGSSLIGGDQGVGNPVGFEPASAPTASTNAGEGSIPLVQGESVAYSGRGLTLRSAGAYVLTWWAA